MKRFNQKWQVGGALLGALGGFVYWHEIGCLTGHCPIQSHWQTMSLWGGIMGYLVTDFFDELLQISFNRHGNAEKTNI